MKKLVFTLCIALTAQFSIAQYDSEALKILDGMSSKYKGYSTFEAHLTQKLINKSAGINEELKIKIVVRGNKFRLTFKDQEIYNNGEAVWTHIPTANEVTVSEYDPDAEDINPAKIYDMYKSGYKYMLEGDQTEGGVLCNVVVLNPEKPGKSENSIFLIRMFIAKKDNRVVAWEMRERSGNVLKFIVTKFTPNVNAPDESFTFDTKKYPGIEIIDLR